MEIVYEIFLMLWNLLDVLFRFIEMLFVGFFTGIPYEAIMFLIGIVFYSLLAYIQYFSCRVSDSDAEDADTKLFLLKLYYNVLSIFMVLFSLWRIGFIILLELYKDKLFYEALGIFVINLLYIIFAIGILYSFKKNVTWLKTAIIALLWTGFLLFTFIISPALNWAAANYPSPAAGYQFISFDTLIQVLFIAAFFVVPKSLSRIREARQGGVAG